MVKEESLEPQGEKKEEVKIVESSDVKYTSEDVGLLMSKIKELEGRINNPGPNSRSANEASLLRELVSGLSKKTDDEKYDGDYVSEEDFDPEDFLDEEDAVSFYAPSVFYIITDDKRNGLPVRTPFRKPINFIYEVTKRVKNGREFDLYNVCKYISRSKKEVEWLENHTFFNSKFFKNMSSTMTAPARKAAKIARAMVSLNNMGQQDIMRLSTDLQLPFMENLDAMRATIAEFQATEAMKQEKEFSRKVLMEQEDQKKELVKKS